MHIGAALAAAVYWSNASTPALYWSGEAAPPNACMSMRQEVYP